MVMIAQILAPPSSIRTPEAGCTLSLRWCQAISEKAADTYLYFALTAAVEAAPSCSSSYKTVEKMVFILLCLTWILFSFSATLVNGWNHYL